MGSAAFVALSEFLRNLESPVTDSRTSDTIEVPASPALPEGEEALRCVRRFRAAVSDAVIAAVQEVVPSIVLEVLGRELLLAEADIVAIAAAALRRFDIEQVLSIAAHPTEIETLAPFGLRRVADGSLKRGEIRLELHSGTIDLTLAERTTTALAAWTG